MKFPSKGELGKEPNKSRHGVILELEAGGGEEGGWQMCGQGRAGRAGPHNPAREEDRDPGSGGRQRGG